MQERLGCALTITVLLFGLGRSQAAFVFDGVGVKVSLDLNITNVSIKSDFATMHGKHSFVSIAKLPLPSSPARTNELSDLAIRFLKDLKKQSEISIAGEGVTEWSIGNQRIACAECILHDKSGAQKIGSVFCRGAGAIYQMQIITGTTNAVIKDIVFGMEISGGN